MSALPDTATGQGQEAGHLEATYLQPVVLAYAILTTLSWLGLSDIGHGQGMGMCTAMLLMWSKAHT